MDHHFEKQVQQRFSTLPSHQYYRIYSLSKRPEDCASLTPTVDQQSTQVVHRLVLVTTATNTQQDGDGERLVSGLEVYEYTTRHSSKNNNKDDDDEQKGTPPLRRTIYISKIDTTGSILARGVTRRLVQAYVASQQQQVGPCSIHVFARAQPQYLFPHSANDPSKRVLTDRQLVAWWRTTLSNKDLYSMGGDDNSSVTTTPFWIVPGVDEQGALYDIGQKQRLVGDHGVVTWRYGYPYAGDALAKDTIPRFEDDGKARYLGTLLDSAGKNNDEDDQQNLTVDDFWTLFGYSEECGAGKLTAIFVIEISSTSTTTANNDDDKPFSSSETTPPPLDDDEYTRIWNSLMTMDFHDESSNLESTKTWLKTWQTIVSLRSFAITSNQNNNIGSNSHHSTGSSSTKDSISQPIQTPTVKRKQPTTSSPRETPNVSNTTTAMHAHPTTDASATVVNVLVPKRRKKEN
ncbi:histone H3-K56 acetyltransferase [Absidia repens]|uniref:histone acetyltransferase n=1 Tax=Absidia repens TaxID=90262 RepID=A0A1X2IR17_9FUNG|nr:histone H3-K56 acetyltransferase [Absidia repens]